MKTLYLVTGADGHLGSTIVRLLKKTEPSCERTASPRKGRTRYPRCPVFPRRYTESGKLKALF